MEAGLSPCEFWDSTPREYAAVIKGVSHRYVREHNWAVTAGFMQVLISRDDKPKSLNHYLVDLGEKARENDGIPKDQLPASEGLKRLFAMLEPMAKKKGE